MKEVLKTLNDLVADGVIENYALGGAIASFFYAEPATTDDLDVFIFLPKTNNSLNLIDLRPLYQALENKGYTALKEHVIIGGIPVQFLPAYNLLVEEGVKEALQKDYEGIPVKVVRIEHLLAIMVQTNRAKDKARIGKLMEEGIKFDQTKLSQILTCHGLQKKWEKIIEAN